MEFDLKYRGLLPAATGSNKQVPGKHHVRQVVREQLEVLWTKDSRFTKIDTSKLQRGTMKEGRFDVQRPIGHFPEAGSTTTRCAASSSSH